MPGGPMPGGPMPGMPGGGGMPLGMLGMLGIRGGIMPGPPGGIMPGGGGELPIGPPGRIIPGIIILALSSGRQPPSMTEKLGLDNVMM